MDCHARLPLNAGSVALISQTNAIKLMEWRAGRRMCVWASRWMRTDGWMWISGSHTQTLLYFWLSGEMWLWEDGKELDIDSAAILLELGLLRDTDLGSQMPCYYTKVNEKKMWHTTFDINNKQIWKMFLKHFINIKAARTDPAISVLNAAVTDAGVFSGRSARITSTDLRRSGCRLRFGSRHELIGTVNQSCPLRDMNIWCHKHTCHCALLENTCPQGCQVCVTKLAQWPYL